MVRGGRFSGKRNFRKKVRSKEGGSDDSDEDYVVSDDGREVSDYYCSSLDGCASEDSFGSFLAEEDEEFQTVRNFNRSKAKKSTAIRPKNASKNSHQRERIKYAEEEEEEDEEELEEEEEEEEEEEYKVEEEEEEEEIQEARNFSRPKAKNGVCSKKRSAGKISSKRGRKIHTEQLEEEEEEVKLEEEEEEEKEKVDRDGNDEEEEGDRDGEDEDFDYEDEDEDDEFFPEEDDYSDEEEEMRGKKKTNDGMKMVKKVFQKKRSSVVSTRGRKRQSSRATKKPLRKKRRKNGRLRKKVRCEDEDEDDFIDNSPTMTTSKKKRGQKRKRVLLSDSEYASSGSSDFEFTISEEEREQVREAKKLCGNLRNNLRSSSHLINNEEVGAHEEQVQLRKPPARKGKEKIEEPQGRKGKEKVEVKSEMGKQVCGICLSEEDKRRVRGVLNCCTHFFCFACIMEWAKVESRCPLCKQRFKTISKPARSTTGIDLREVVIQVPERDQVYQPSEEELRSYIDPYEYVICSECHQGGDDGLMLLCDICDSPAHTYCVGLGREVPEGNWYCEGCRPVALGSSSSQVQEGVADPRLTIQNLPVRPPPALHVRESIDLNLISSPRAAFNQGFGHLPSSRFSGRSVEGSSPVSGGAPTLSERRWIHRQIQQLLSIDRMAATPGRTTNGFSATSSTSNLYSTQIDQSRGTATLHARTQDVGTSYHTFFDDRLCNNTSPLMQNGPLWPGLMATPPVPDCEQVHQFSRSNIVPDDGLSTAVREETNFHTAKEQLQSMVKSHLKSLSQNIDLGHSTFKDVARSSMHTILAACDLEHKNSEVCNVPPPSACPHMELMAGGPTSLIKGCCSSCFDSFVGDVVKRVLDTRVSSQWLRLGL
ncbi:uncharacterized protein LOC114191996 isoform X3 [Vigna unguiculata]|nr:uncharacterized protein LOC114191996 isoform X3 [Vigna unguiculata]